MTFLSLFGALTAAHAICDYPLQGDFLARAKNRAAPIAGVPWYQALGAHAIIHGGAVALLTGIPFLGLLEAAAHAFIDDLKCTGRIGFNVDQAAHIGCKLLWAAIASLVIANA
jgi:hypothetical protein